METAYFSTEDVARMVGTTRGNVYSLCKRGRLPFIKQGRRVLIPRQAWEAFISAQSEAALRKVEA